MESSCFIWSDLKFEHFPSKLESQSLIVSNSMSSFTLDTY